MKLIDKETKRETGKDKDLVDEGRAPVDRFDLLRSCLREMKIGSDR